MKVKIDWKILLKHKKTSNTIQLLPDIADVGHVYRSLIESEQNHLAEGKKRRIAFSLGCWVENIFNETNLAVYKPIFRDS